MKKVWLIISLGCAALVGCTADKLNVYTEYYSFEDLASYHVETPDPILHDPPVGQRLVVSWSLPSDYLLCEDLHILVHIRFCNKEEVIKKICIEENTGIHTFCLTNESYFEKGGILTYKVELYGNHILLDEWCHQLWVDLITFKE